MNARRLVGRNVVIVVSDPWEFVDASGNNRFEGTVTEVQPFSPVVRRETVLVRLATTLTCEGVLYGSLLVGARQGDRLLDALAMSDVVECALIGVPVNVPPAVDSMDAWRGGLAGTGSVTVSQ